MEDPGTSAEEDPSHGVTEAGILGRGLICQGSLVDVERAVITIIGDNRELVLATYPHASKSENMEAIRSFMISDFVHLFISLARLTSNSG